jgi:hypothetical protein
MIEAIKYILSTPWAFGVANLVYNLFFIARFWYREVDWTSYMAQVELFRAGERDYTKLIGPEGPANYPAGFIYVYWVMQILTNQDYRIGQVIHAFSMLTYSIYH